MTSESDFLNPRIDYLAKDYTSLLRLLQDQVSTLVPGWTERNAADLGVTVLELLAYAGDYLSYFQDAAAAEAYLATARRRFSVARHVRLLDYTLSEGLNARVFVAFETSAEALHLAAHQVLLSEAGVPPPFAPASLLDQYSGPTFETMHSATLRREHNRMLLLDERDTLPPGTVQTWLAGHLPHLRRGDVLILEQARGTGAKRPDPHPVRLSHDGALETSRAGHPITRIQWLEADALTETLTLSWHLPAGQYTGDMASAVGNVVLADQGRTWRELLPEVPESGRYRPSLSRTGLAYTVPYQQELFLDVPAAHTLAQDPNQAEPVLSVREMDPALPEPLQVECSRLWRACGDPLTRSCSRPNFALEIDNSGQAFLHFARSSESGAPLAGASMRAVYRTSSGAGGNVGADTLRYIVSEHPSILAVRNPLPASGGQDPETLQHARINAPAAFHLNRRCVTNADYEAMAMTYPSVQGAIAHRTFAGTVPTVTVTISRTEGRPVPQDFLERVKAFLTPFAMIGDYVVVKAALVNLLELRFTLQVLPGYVKSLVAAGVKTQVQKEIAAKPFLPGELFYSSRWIALAMQVPGVADAQLTAQTTAVHPGSYEAVNSEPDNTARPSLAGFPTVVQIHQVIVLNEDAS